MKKTSLVLIFLSMVFAMTAQNTITGEKEEKIHNMGLDFSAGYSLPIGNYGAYDKTNKKSGYASYGYLVQVAFDWMGKKDFGLAIQYTFQHNQLKDTASHVVIDGMNNVTLGPDAWSNHYLMIGPVFMKSIRKIYIDAKILGGVILSSSSNFNTPDPTDTSRLRYNNNFATGFSWQISAGIGYKISPHVALKFNLNLMGGWPDARKQYRSQLIGYEKYFDPVTGLTYDKPVYSAPVEYLIKKVITTVNPSIGLVYRF